MHNCTLKFYIHRPGGVECSLPGHKTKGKGIMNIVKKIGLPVAISFLAVSCTSTYIVPEKNTKAINFQSPETVTKAVVNDANGMDGFSVWGWYGKEGNTVGNVFAGTDVTKKANGEWGYEGTQYWIPGYVYDFYAVYPSSLSGVTVNESGEIAVTGFDCSATGADAVDLMTASRLDMSGDAPEKVAFTFSHELARLKFTVIAENTEATVNSFKVYGLNVNADFSKTESGSVWSDPVACTKENTPFILGEPFSFNSVNGWEKNMLGDVLVIPDSDLSDAELEISYRYPGESTDRTAVLDLNSSTSVWNAASSYNYIVRIKGSSLTVEVKVVPWSTEDTSVSW